MKNLLPACFKLSIVLSFFIGNELSAQLSANFTANITSGCKPLTNVQFTSSSTGNPTSYQWIFQNNGTSNVQNPVKTFTNAGVYDVTLIVSNGTTSDTMVKPGFIKVYDNPVPDFSSNVVTGCSPLNVSFSDISLQTDTNIVAWLWDFGTGNVSLNQNPSFTYTAPGNYSVSLQITDANGCKGFKSVNNYISVVSKPVVAFSANPTVACTPPLSVNFTNNSTGTGLTYFWSFGNGNTSSVASPSTTYTNYGVYNVSLVATNSSGCKDSVTQNNLIQVVSVQAGFTMSKDTVCVSQSVQFTNTSLGGNSYIWFFGDGGSSSATSPAYSYSSPGDYIIKLVALGPQGACKDSITDTIHVEFVSAGFSTNPAYGCNVPLNVSYTDMSVNAVSWQWNFGNGNTSTLQNPSNTFNSSGSFTDILTVTSKNGCTATISKPNNVNIFMLQPAFTPSVVNGCIPLVVNFSDMTNPVDSIQSWSWNFGDPGSGVNNTSVVQNPSHTFNTDGSFGVTLTITDKSGCTHIFTDTIRTGNKPVIDFTSSADTSCAIDAVTFTDASFDSTKNNYWQWMFGDGGSGNGNTAQHQFTDTGYISVTLIVGYNGCRDTLVRDSAIYINGPYIAATSSFNCDTPFTYAFNLDSIKGANRWYWNFGDGSPLDSVSVNPVHTYASTGDYTINVTAYNDSTGCDFPVDISIFVRDIAASFSSDTIYGCPGLNVLFNGSSSQDEVSYQWDFADGSPPVSQTVDTVLHQFTTKGLYPVKLIVTDVNGCLDSTYRNIKIYSPVADFAANVTSGCVPLSVNFSDLSTPDTTITAWAWDFGNGQTSGIQNPSTIYNSIGLKTVSLTVTDAIGCTSSITKTNYIAPLQPIPAFSVNDNTICKGTAVSFTNTSVNNSGNSMTYFWDFGDMQTSAAVNPVHVYNDTGYFTITLKATDALLGCDSQKVFTNMIHVQDIPVPAFTVNSKYFGCYPSLALFTDTTQSPYVTSWLWDFGDNSTSNLKNPAHNYTAPGLYTVKLTVTTSYGCSATITKTNYITIDGPIAQFSLSPDTVCKSEPVSFVITFKNNVSNIDWDFDDGTGMFSTGDSVAHYYTQVGTMYPKLIFSSSNGCTQVIQDTVFVHFVSANFGLSDTARCVPVNVLFSDSSINADNYVWNFGDGTTSSVQNPQHNYTTAGNYTITLIINDVATGCTDSVKKQIVVYPLPVITKSSDTLICRGQSASLYANSPAAVSYAWSPASSLNNPNIYNPIASPNSNTNYTVIVTDTNNCTNTALIKVTVQQSPVITYGPTDTTIIIGDTVQIAASFNIGGITYNWSPSTGLSCTNCLNPVAQPLETTTYTITYSDTNACFNLTETLIINVIKDVTIDVPKAFTPNGDNVNDMIFVKGWGIKELIEFKVFNRWGQMVFESNDLNTGWDGSLNGTPQPTETYAYIVVAEMYTGERLSKKGHIQIIR
jgi:gliding motility-associated-like protein